MDVTSQLNLEREAGMGENTERQPAEPASAGGGSGDLAQARGANGAGTSLRGGRVDAFFLPRAAHSLASLPATPADSGPAPRAPPHTHSFALLRRTTHPKQQTENYR